MAGHGEAGYTRAYHYTTFIHIKDILDSSLLLRSSSWHNEVPAVWFSLNHKFEYGSGMHARHPKTGESRELTFDVLANKIGLARFATDAASLIPFPEVMARGLMAPSAADFNQRYVSQYGGTTDDWLVSISDVPLSRITGADLYLDGWVRMTPETIAEMGLRLPRGIGATWKDLFGKPKRRTPKRRKKRGKAGRARKAG